MARAHNRKYKADPARVRELLNYDPIKGIFTWRIHRGRNCCIGQEAGFWSHGYRRICIDGVRYDCAYLAWVHFYGCEPDGVVDHKDLNKSHDAIDNLREASQSQNFCNQNVRSSNAVGLKGVSWNKARSKWIAKIHVLGKKYHMGTFDDPQIAAAAYRIGAATLHGEFARAG